MPSAGRTATKSRSRKSPTAARRRSKPQSLLVLHFDAQKFRADHLHLEEIAAATAAISELALGGSIVVKDVTTKSDLMSKLARFAEAGMAFDVVVAVGHSNADGIRIARDLFLQWGPFAQLLKPFKPRRLLLVACQAGRADAGETLFRGLPELRPTTDVPASPQPRFVQNNKKNRRQGCSRPLQDARWSGRHPRWDEGPRGEPVRALRPVHPAPRVPS